MDPRNKFRQLFQENCTSLTPEGEKFFAPLKQTLSELFSSEEFKSMSETQKHIVGSMISNLIGNHVSDSIRERTELVNMYSAMSDEVFETYLKDKYGAGWFFKTLTPEEFDRSRPIARANIAKIMEGVREKMSKKPPYMPRIVPLPRRPYRR